MAITIIQNHDEYNAPHYMEFIIDNDSERADLPGLDVCCAGSKATSIESGSKYYLTTFGLWTGPQKAFETEELRVDANGIYTADPGKAFNPVYVDVSGGGGGDQQINYTVNWDGYTSGRAKSTVNGVPFVQISDYYPKIDGTTQAEVEASVAEWIVDPVITLSTREAGTLTFPATLSVAPYFDEGGLMDWECAWIISLGDSSETPVFFAPGGIACIDLELASSILGSDIINVKLTWHRTGQLMPGERGFRIVSTSPLTLDVLNRAAAVVENRIFDENGTFPPRPYSVGYETVTVDVPHPNYVKIITGTLANPWGSDDQDVVESFLTDLRQKVSDHNATAYLLVDGTAIGRDQYVTNMSSTSSSAVAWFEAANYDSLSGGFLVLCLGWNTLTGGLEVAEALIDGATMDLTQYASTIATTLTVIFHPLPDSGE